MMSTKTRAQASCLHIRGTRSAGLLLSLALSCTPCIAQIRPGGAPPTPAPEPEKKKGPITIKCPVTKKVIPDKKAAPYQVVNDLRIYFCSDECIATFKKTPEKYLKRIEDPVTGYLFAIKATSPRLENGGALYIFKNGDTLGKFQQDPDKWIRILRRAISEREAEIQRGAAGIR